MAELEERVDKLEERVKDLEFNLHVEIGNASALERMIDEDVKKLQERVEKLEAKVK